MRQSFSSIANQQQAAQQHGFAGDNAPDLRTQAGAMVHYVDPNTREWVQMTLQEYADAGFHRYAANGGSIWSGPWVARQHLG